MGNKSEVARYGGNEATYLGAKIRIANDGDSRGDVSGSNKYEKEIIQVEIPHDRMLAPNEPLEEAHRSMSR